MTQMGIIHRMFADFGLETEEQRGKFRPLAGSPTARIQPHTYAFIILSDSTQTEETTTHAELARDPHGDQILRQHT